MKLLARMEGASGLSGRRRAMLASCALALLPLVMAQLALDQRPSSAQQATLRGLASQRGLFVGAAVDANALANEATYRTVLAREYNSVTAENAMKWGVVEPNQGQFNWTQADALFSFDGAVFVPAGWTGRMPNGDPINSQSTFMSIRSWYQSDPDWSKVQAYLNGGAAPTFRYHRFWAQADIATAQATYGMLFPTG